MSSSSYTVFLTTLFFTTLHSSLKSVGTVFDLSISNLSTSAKPVFLADFDVSKPAAFLRQIFFCMTRQS